MANEQNSANGPSNDAIAYWMRQYRTQRRLCDVENSVLRNIVKRAKADGVNTGEMIAAIGATKMEPDVAIKNLRDQIRYRGILRMAVTAEDVYDGWQVDLGARQSEEDALWNAGDEGWKAGRAASLLTECKYPPGSPYYVAYANAWHAGQAANAREMGEDVKQASTGRERPARGAAAPKADAKPNADAKQKRAYTPRKAKAGGDSAPTTTH